MENQEFLDTEATKVNQDCLGCQDLKEKRVIQEKIAQFWDYLGLEVNQAQGGNKAREESPEQRDIRVTWVHQGQEAPLDNKGPQASQVTRANKD